MSLPVPPLIVSAPVPPSSWSLPPLPFNISLPARPKMRSLPDPPLSVSSPDVPVIVAMMMTPDIGRSRDWLRSCRGMLGPFHLRWERYWSRMNQIGGDYLEVH